MCNTTVADYIKFKTVLEDLYLSEAFPYQHVIIDEGDLEGTGLTKKSVVMAEQICPVDKRDIVMCLGTLPKKYIGSVERALRVQMGLA